MRHLTTLVLSLALCVPSIAAIAPSVKAQESSTSIQALKNERVITVTGRGERSVKTTKARIQLGVTAEGKTAIAVQEEIGRQANSIVSRLQQLGVEKLQTTSIQLNPKYVYENNLQRGLKTVSRYWSRTWSQSHNTLKYIFKLFCKQDHLSAMGKIVHDNEMI